MAPLLTALQTHALQWTQLGMSALEVKITSLEFIRVCFPRGLAMRSSRHPTSIFMGNVVLCSSISADLDRLNGRGRYIHRPHVCPFYLRSLLSQGLKGVTETPISLLVISMSGMSQASVFRGSTIMQEGQISVLSVSGRSLKNSVLASMGMPCFQVVWLTADGFEDSQATMILEQWLPC